MLTYIIIGMIVSAVLMWLIVWKDACETQTKRKPYKLPKEVKLGDLLIFVSSFLGAIAFWPIMFIISIGMIWDVYNLSSVVVWTKDKDISLKGFDD